MLSHILPSIALEGLDSFFCYTVQNQKTKTESLELGRRALPCRKKRKDPRSFETIGEGFDVESEVYCRRRSGNFWRMRASLGLACAQAATLGTQVTGRPRSRPRAAARPRALAPSSGPGSLPDQHSGRRPSPLSPTSGAPPCLAPSSGSGSLSEQARRGDGE